jgi:alpha-mannosidase
MNARQLFLLSPYRLPTQSTLYLGDDEVSAFLNGYTALWHPAALRGASDLPRVASPYDHENPESGFIYAVPDNPPLMLSDDWEDRARAAGAVVFRATSDREQTLANLLTALAHRRADAAPGGSEDDPDRKLTNLDPTWVAPFLAIGFGVLQLEALFEAMSHDNVLASAELWEDITAALSSLTGADAEEARPHLQSACDRLLSAREVVYPTTIYLVDLCLLDDQHLDAPWPAALDKGQPTNFIACSALLERLARDQPARIAALRERVAGDLAEICGGPYLEREAALLPLETQLWNLLKGQAVYQELVGQEVRVFGRKRFGYHTQLPLLLHNVGISRALLLAFDESVLPVHRSPVVSWPSPDGKQVDTFTRAPHPADTPQTFFHLAYQLHQTIMQDQSATLALLHRDGKRAAPWYEDWLELNRWAPVLGRWVTLSVYFNEVLAGDYTSAASPDEFHGEYLMERTGTRPEAQPTTGPVVATPYPISGFVRHIRGRRRLDTAWTLAALLRSLGGRVDPFNGEPYESFLTKLEDRLESEQAVTEEELLAAQQHAAVALAARLVARGQENHPGFLVLNPCSFTRRVVLELSEIHAPLPVTGPLKACQVDNGMAHLVVEVPALGFAWIPREVRGAVPVSTSRLRLADDRCVRNEFLEAEVDTQTGGLRALRDPRTRVGRIGQQLVFNPGSTMRVREIRTTSSGPALGEIVSEGVLVDAQEEVLATFRQRFRAWLGRPMLDLRIEISPTQPPQGYPWHNYYAARFAWRDERATLLRGANGYSAVTTATQPETPDYLEIRNGRQNTVLFPGGLPFHQRQGGRMLDVLLVAQGETNQVFDLGLSLDREHPMQTALGTISPVAVVPTEKGPPHVGANGWLFHLDAPFLLLTSLRPGAEGSDAVMARLLECSGVGGPAELHCVRDPKQGLLMDARGNVLLDATTQGDAVLLDVAGHDLVQLRIEFT